MAPGIADAVDFTLHPAIRNGTGKAGDCAANSFSCPDEPCGCPHTRWVLCGMHFTPDNSQANQVNFLTCFDTQNIAFSNDWVTGGEMPNPMQAAQACAEQLNLDWEAIHKCAGNITGNVDTGNYTEIVGQQGLELQIKASKYFYDTFFKARTGVKFYVPNLYIGDVEQTLTNTEDMWNITKALCASGAKASICSVAHEAGNPSWPGTNTDKVHQDHTKKFTMFHQPEEEPVVV